MITPNNNRMQTIVTSHYVRIQQTPASVGERILARLIDLVICGVYGWILYLLFSFLEEIRLSDNTLFTLLILLIIPILLYSPLWEIFNNGQSPGKQILHMRVVKADGTIPTLGSAIMRWLLYLVEGPFLSCWGIIPMLLNQRHQRMGDLAAGTVVIKDNSYEQVKISLDEFDYLTHDYKPLFPQAEDLSTEQAALIQRTLDTHNVEQQQRIATLAAKVKQLLSITTTLPDEDFLARLLRDYQYYAAIEL